MFMRKCERKKRNPYFMITLFSLAAIGAAGVINCTKSFIKEKSQCVMSLFQKKCDEKKEASE